MIASHTSSPREPSSRFTSNPGTADQPVRRDHDRDAVDLEVVAPVVLQVEDALADELRQRPARERPLHLARVDVGVGDLGVEVELREDAERVEAGVGVGELHPPHVLLGMHQHGVVHDPAGGRRHEHVLALLDGAAGEIAAGDRVDQPVGVRAADLHRALDPDVPEGHALLQRPVLDRGIVVLGRQVHLVVDVVGLAPRALRAVEERRAPVPGAEVERRRRRVVLHAALRWLVIASSASAAPRNPDSIAPSMNPDQPLAMSEPANAIRPSGRRASA